MWGFKTHTDFYVRYDWKNRGGDFRWTEFFRLPQNLIQFDLRLYIFELDEKNTLECYLFFWGDRKKP